MRLLLNNKQDVVGQAIFSNVKLLMGMENGPNASTTFLDESSIGHGFAVVGSAQISTGQSKFGTRSMLLNGTTAGVNLSENGSLDFGSQDFTVEAWIRQGASSVGIRTIFDKGTLTVSKGWNFYLNNGSQLVFIWSTDGTNLTNSAECNVAIPADTWTHVAACRVGGFVRVFINGVSGTPVADSTTIFDSTSGLRIGISSNETSRFFAGNFDEIRIIKGQGIYASNFTPPTAAFPRS